MSGIERFVAAILLVAAVGGTAAVGHHMVGPPAVSVPVRLTATPPQHVSAPRPVWAPLAPPARLARPGLQAIVPVPAQVRRSAPIVALSRPLVVPHVTKPLPRPPAPAPAKAAPALAPPAPAPAPAPVVVTDPTRVLAEAAPVAVSVPADPAPPEADAWRGHGHGNEHRHDDGGGDSHDDGGHDGHHHGHGHDD